jgi:hypothetical protein
MNKDHLLENDKLTLSEFRKFMFYPIYPIEDLKVWKGEKSLYEHFPFWRKNNLLPFIPKGKWNVQISFAQLIWLRMLEHLRELGYGIADTKLLCQGLFKDAYYDELPKKKLKFHYDRLKKLEQLGAIDQEDKEIMQRLGNMLEDALLLYGLKFEFNYLTEVITWCIDNKTEAGILVYPNGRYMIRQGKEIISFEKNTDKIDTDSPHIYLSVLYFLKEFVQSDQHSLIKIPGILSEKEHIVINALRDKNISELIIKITGGDIIRIDSKMIYNLSADKVKKIREVIYLGQYEEISLSMRDHQTMTLKKTNKQMLSGKT